MFGQFSASLQQDRQLKDNLPAEKSHMRSECTESTAETMSNDKEDGMQKLFRIPDLVEKLLPFLDATSTLSLAQSKISCVLHILQQRSAPWDKMVRRTLSDSLKIMWSRDRSLDGMLILDSEEHANRVSESFQEKRVQLLSLVGVFKLIDLKIYLTITTCYVTRTRLSFVDLLHVMAEAAKYVYRLNG